MKWRKFSSRFYEKTNCKKPFSISKAIGRTQHFPWHDTIKVVPRTANVWQPMEKWINQTCRSIEHCELWSKAGEIPYCQDALPASVGNLKQCPPVTAFAWSWPIIRETNSTWHRRRLQLRARKAGAINKILLTLGRASINVVVEHLGHIPQRRLFNNPFDELNILDCCDKLHILKQG